MSVADQVNKHLAEMRAAGRLSDVRKKGELGEAAVMDIMHHYRTKRGGLLYQGFMYPYASNRQGQLYLGNIFWDADNQKYFDVTKQVNDEIDILYVSPNRIFAIEVKSYHMKKAVLDNRWLVRDGAKVDKSPPCQAEKHARHLYHQLYDVLPDGDPRYIVPIVVFVDRVHQGFEDNRSPDFVFYMPVIGINSLQKTIIDCDYPVTEYTLDLPMIEKKLQSIQRERTL